MGRMGGGPLRREFVSAECAHGLSPEEALDYGIVGKIIKSAADLS